MNKIYLDDLIGLPYHPVTNNCWTCVEEVSRRAGIILPKYDDPIEFSKRRDLINSQKPFYTKLEKPEPWCLVLFRFLMIDGIHLHVGVVLPGCNKFIHVVKKTGTCITRLNHPLYWFMTEGFYKYKVKI